MRLCQAALDTCLYNPLPCQPLSSRFALDGLRTLEIQSWLVHAKVRKPHLNPQVRMNFPSFYLLNKGERQKVRMNQRAGFRRGSRTFA